MNWMYVLFYFSNNGDRVYALLHRYLPFLIKLLKILIKEESRQLDVRPLCFSNVGGRMFVRLHRAFAFFSKYLNGTEVIGCSSFYFPNNRGWVFAQLHYYSPSTNFKSNNNNTIGTEMIGCSSFRFPNDGGWVFTQLHHYLPFINPNHTLTTIWMEPE